MSAKAKALAVIVAVLLAGDVLLTIVSCRAARQNATPAPIHAPTRTPTAARALITVGPISTFTPTSQPTPTPTRAPTRVLSPTLTVTPSRPTPTPAALPQTLPKTGGDNQ